MNSDLNLSEGLKRRLSANDSAFEGKVMLGINDNSSSYQKTIAIFYKDHIRKKKPIIANVIR